MEITPELVEILEYLGQDLTRRQIARKLQMPEGTLKKRLRTLYAGLKVEGIDEAAAWARSNGYAQEREDPLPFHTLRPRELEVIEHLVENKTVKEIAKALLISEDTVHGYLAHAYQHLGESNRYEIIKAYKKLKKPPSIEKEVLSPMLRKVLKALCQDLKNWQIANELFISEDTVKTHLKRLYKALGVKDRAEAIAWGKRNGYS